MKAISDYDWDVVDEYDPLWPNEYEKLVKDKRDKDMERSRERKRNRRNNTNIESPPVKFSGFSARPDDEENYNSSPPAALSANRIGAAIAPPPSLQESIPNSNEPKPSIAQVQYGTGSVAAKIMAKYGFREGQGLGKQEQGMAVALQVEKTSKRGGRIIHEKELLMPPPLNPAPAPDSPTLSSLESSNSSKQEPSITEIMKSPSKVVLLRVSCWFHLK